MEEQNALKNQIVEMMVPPPAVTPVQPKRRMSFDHTGGHDEDDSLARRDKAQRRQSVKEIAPLKWIDLPKVEKDKVELLRIDLDDPKSKLSFVLISRETRRGERNEGVGAVIPGGSRSY